VDNGDQGWRLNSSVRAYNPHHRHGSRNFDAVLTCILRLTCYFALLVCYLVNRYVHNNKLATVILGLPYLFLVMNDEHMPTTVPQHFYLDLSKHAMCNVNRFRLRVHTLRVEAAALLQGTSFVCDQCPDEAELVQNEEHVLLFCHDLQVCDFFLIAPYYEDFLAARPDLRQ